MYHYLKEFRRKISENWKGSWQGIQFKHIPKMREITVYLYTTQNGPVYREKFTI